MKVYIVVTEHNDIAFIDNVYYELHMAKDYLKTKFQQKLLNDVESQKVISPVEELCQTYNDCLKKLDKDWSIENIGYIIEKEIH